MAIKSVHIIGVPLDLGGGRRGVDMGPSAMRIAGLDERIAAAEGAERERLRAERDAEWTAVRAEKLGELATEFDGIHSVQRAVEVGSVDRVIPASSLRADLIDTIERGMGALDQASSARRNTATVSSNAWSVTSGS